MREQGSPPLCTRWSQRLRASARSHWPFERGALVGSQPCERADRAKDKPFDRLLLGEAAASVNMKGAAEVEREFGSHSYGRRDRRSAKAGGSLHPSLCLPRSQRSLPKLLDAVDAFTALLMLISAETGAYAICGSAPLDPRPATARQSRSLAALLIGAVSSVELTIFLRE